MAPLSFPPDVLHHRAGVLSRCVYRSLSDPAGLSTPIRLCQVCRPASAITPWSQHQPREPTTTNIHHLGYKGLHQHS
ncbi:hypothetical protein CesoFtcFv8_014316 [Champsocephalus esox]|uniref:Uncharacterized protein n=1 Tax=Champsocephalus esox TaxID=159716 RepID=A0AAN8BWN9_9TELE|nr:hypothetical protein CesoFtcFv8_014316 [Champsocephalus esox]